MAHLPTAQLLHGLFQRAMEQHGERVAVAAPQGVRTFRQLASDAGAVAVALGGDQGERICGVLLTRDTPWLYGAQLGALQAGAAHLCLDPVWPDARLREQLLDAGCRHVITDAVGCQRIQALSIAGLIPLDVALLTPVQQCAPFAGTSDRLAYCIYTSGTTGRPKGVLVEHGSIYNLVASDLDEFRLGPGDRVAQGSSPAYDSAIEETWLALASGATLVPVPDDVIRSGPDLVSWLQRERITVFCPPPTLLQTTGCTDPATDLPDLGLLYVGGEALPRDLADRWATGRRMVNGYGPTECAVTVTRGDVVPGQEVTIGTPVPGNHAEILDQDLEPVAAGEWGELCIAGVQVARGYRGRASAPRFVDHPRYGRIYRTGDRAQLGPDGALRYGGRLDSQVKIRGHRVELEEIEARLAAIPGVQAAACAVQAGDLLVAHGVATDPAAPPDAEGILARLRRELPDHMVPATLGWTDQLPTSTGGKLDRKALPTLTPGADRPLAGDAPQGTQELAVAAAWCAVLGIEEIPRDVDFFTVGGNSLRAAEVITRLRQLPASDPLTNLTVRDLYESPTIQGLARRAPDAAPEVKLPPPGPPPGQRLWMVTTLQTLWLSWQFTVGAAIAWLLIYRFLPWALQYLEPIPLVLLIGILWLPVWIALTVLGVGTAALAKKLLIGRYRPARHPVWGWWYLRHWLVQRMVQSMPWGLLRGTELQLTMLRWLGAKIGQGVFVHPSVDLLAGGWDLLEIGDGAAIGQDATLGLCELDRGHVVVGPIRIGSGATVEVRGGVEGDTVVEPNAWVTALSHVPSGSRIPSGEIWDGIPAGPSGTTRPPPTADHPGQTLGRWRHDLLYIATSYTAGTLVAWPGLLSTLILLYVWDLDSAYLTHWLGAPSFDPLRLTAFLALVVGSIPVGLLLEALLLRWGPKVAAGTHRVRTVRHILALVRSRVLDSAMGWLSGTLFWPVWLRLAGARIGRDTEISSIMDVLPEHLTIGTRTFLADGIYLGGPRVGQGLVRVGPVQVGADSFLGNHVVIHPDTRLPEGILLGVCTVAHADEISAHSSWFGHPPFRLPKREVVITDERLTLSPGPLRFARRVFWEGLRFCLPLAPTAIGFGWLVWLAPTAEQSWNVWLPQVLLASNAAALALVGLILALKWLLLGRVQPGQHGLWSSWCSRWDFLYVAWGQLASGILAPLGGTIWLAWYLRAMGVRVGKRVVLGGGFAQVVDPDMLRFGDDTTVDTMFQAHSFEDRVLKIDRVTLEPNSTLRRSSVLLYGAHIGAHATVAPHSVVMKHEHLLPGRTYVGVPTRPTDRTPS